MKKLLQSLTITGVILFSVFVFSGCTTSQYVASNPYDYTYNNPTWAPQYYTGTRYYYLPDIECYYDLGSRNFILLHNGQWIYVESISPYYSSYNLFDSYVVIVNVNIYQPWMHHQYYNSHYPRYYYRDYYDYSNIPYVRGFNENKKHAIYWDEKDRGKSRNWDDRNLKNNRKFTYSDEDRRMQDETTKRTNQSGRVTNSTNNRNTTNSKNDRNNDNNRTSNVNNNTNRTDNNNTTRTNNNTTRSDNNVNNNTPTRTENTSGERTTTTERRSDTNYYGKPIGRPVKVEPQMRNTNRSDENTSRSRNNSTTSPSRNTNDNSSSSRTSNSNSTTNRTTDDSSKSRTRQ